MKNWLPCNLFLSYLYTICWHDTSCSPLQAPHSLVSQVSSNSRRRRKLLVSSAKISKFSLSSKSLANHLIYKSRIIVAQAYSLGEYHITLCAQKIWHHPSQHIVFYLLNSWRTSYVVFPLFHALLIYLYANLIRHIVICNMLLTKTTSLNHKGKQVTNKRKTSH